ncbi:MAG: 23S rRNA (adenine(2030)-N(6))-methyltransferase RlmJ [Burkholderiales bacterium 66-5]|uniref:23S rRNA (adenine(2030)-N(6))-methyltransferase RlmJ n=1 Tax=Comamonas badia TaxID=265291 RepID=UPI0004290AD3|nr:23S rRNA (adenine(2030)-N(6))-methyltransferase RlmJ [Comamonas badia]OJU90918.1 MAG: 23S rRNA (adenine(2030)-N(6))-methyltransferase RlmJ [Burkholderiales bacterium 66-5]
MFSYRHAFHAGNHGDVLKHTVLIACLRHLTLKETGLTVIDTHAGAGLYRLDGDYARTSGEALEGVQRLSGAADLAPALQDYLEVVRSFNSKSALRIYPGSPFITQRLLRPQDRLRLFEIHPSDLPTLVRNVAQLEADRQITVYSEDGFEGIKKLLPPQPRRALLLCDPSYELKSDYARVHALLQEAIKRFATGCYAVWYPVIARPEAHELPRRLKALAARAGKPWLHATLTVKSARVRKLEDGSEQRPGLPGSGMFLVNPPYLLQEQLQAALPQMAELLAQDDHASHLLETG